ncbi:aquaporin [Cellulomonas composti]|uniref:Aquaporin Z n=1 Tax=Cellulomonas composti TaxID=266130 RepID=A0A511J977_9CELL|nr:aquaporin [Cellulomonas composti]GEL94546.1 hypothetical protein CCO02nite_12040 [Cellulomonas composti]
MSQDTTPAGSPEPDPTPAPLEPAPGYDSPVNSEPVAAPVEAAPVFEPQVEPPVAVAAGSSLLARLGAELFGTFFLVLAGLGVALYASAQFAGVGGGAGALAVALAFGIAVAGGAAAVGHVSGGHFNPAVTLGACIAGRTPWRDLLPYWLVQLVGGAIAASAVFVTIPSGLAAQLSSGGTGPTTTRAFFSGLANGFGDHSPLGTASSGELTFSLFAALVVEVIVTAVFVGVILGVTDRRADSKIAPLIIGLTLAVLILVAMPATNASVNPARSFAAALYSDTWAWQQLWAFVVAPLAGGALAAIVYRAFANPPLDDEEFGDDESAYEVEEIVVVERSA